MTRVRIWENIGLLRVVDHEAALMDPKLFSSWVHRSVVLLKRGFGRQTAAAGGASRETTAHRTGGPPRRKCV
jgi:hypothetical protein